MRSKMKKRVCFCAAVLCAALLSISSLPVLYAAATEGGIGKDEPSSSEEAASSEAPVLSSEDPISSELPVSSEGPVSSEQEPSSSEEVSSTLPESSEVSSGEEVSSSLEFPSEDETDPSTETSENQHTSSGPPDWFYGQVTSGASQIDTSTVTSAESSSSSGITSSSSSSSSSSASSSSSVTTNRTTNHNRFLLFFGLFLIVAGFAGLIFFIVLQVYYVRSRRQPQARPAAPAGETFPKEDAAAFAAGAAVYTGEDDNGDYGDYSGAFVLSDNDRGETSEFDAMSDEELDARLAEYEAKAKNRRVNGDSSGRSRPRH